MIFILSSVNMSSCIVMVIWDGSALTVQLCPCFHQTLWLSCSGTSEKVAPVGMFIRMACAMADMALATASKTLV